MTENEVWNLLTGTWINEKVEFRISKDRKVFYSAHPGNGDISIRFIEEAGIWQISVPIFYWTLAHIVVLNETNLDVVNDETGRIFSFQRKLA